MASKRQITMAKLDRERAVRERRARKQEKKDARRAAKRAAAPDTPDATANTPPEGSVP